MIRTDLAMEMAQGKQQVSGVELTNDIAAQGINRVKVSITNEQGEKALGKKIGTYVTLESSELVHGDADLDERCAKALADEIREMAGAGLGGSVLVIGLGNRMVTPDALGPAVCGKVFVTRHIHEYAPKGIDERLGNVSAISPGVLGITGVETLEVIEGVVSRINPSLIIAVDSLASRSLGRVRTTVQIEDSGISPGGGIGNLRKAIDEQTLGVPVLAIGVPLVVYASTIAQDLLESVKTSLNDKQVNDVIRSLMDADGADMIVTPKDIDKVVNDLARIISDGINLALHKGLTIEETRKYMY